MREEDYLLGLDPTTAWVSDSVLLPTPLDNSSTSHFQDGWSEFTVGLWLLSREKLTGLCNDGASNFALMTLYSTQLSCSFSDSLVGMSLVGLKPLPFIED